MSLSGVETGRYIQVYESMFVAAADILEYDEHRKVAHGGL